MIGIYKIINTKNNKVYIGQSWNIDQRFFDHSRELEHNRHFNKHLQRSWDKYGKDSFLFEVVREFNDNALTQILLDIFEDKYIRDYNSIDANFGYNKRRGGSCGKLTEETKLKISKKEKGKIISQESIEKRRKSMIGRKMGPCPEERKLKISASNKGKHYDRIGKHLSEETKRKLSIARIGRPSPQKGKHLSDETKEKIRTANIGKKYSQEVKDKLSKNRAGKPWTQKRIDTYMKQVESGVFNSRRPEHRRKLK